MVKDNIKMFNSFTTSATKVRNPQAVRQEAIEKKKKEDVRTEKIEKLKQERKEAKKERKREERIIQQKQREEEERILQQQKEEEERILQQQKQEEQQQQVGEEAVQPSIEEASNKQVQDLGRENEAPPELPQSSDKTAAMGPTPEEASPRMLAAKNSTPRDYKEAANRGLARGGSTAEVADTLSPEGSLTNPKPDHRQRRQRRRWSRATEETPWCRPTPRSISPNTSRTPTDRHAVDSCDRTYMSLTACVTT